MSGGGLLKEQQGREKRSHTDIKTAQRRGTREGAGRGEFAHHSSVTRCKTQTGGGGGGGSQSDDAHPSGVWSLIDAKAWLMKSFL